MSMANTPFYYRTFGLLGVTLASVGAYGITAYSLVRRANEIGEPVALDANRLFHPNYRVFHGEPSDLRSFSGIFQKALTLDGRGIIQFGLVLLAATPIARVVFSIWGFAAEHDRMYGIFATVVPVILLFSLFGAGSGY